ncbi:MAG: hypothetical protein IPF66_05490 [Holophagales bacterium]|nr:hypothetical protein [Holophagales bacterium]
MAPLKDEPRRAAPPTTTEQGKRKVFVETWGCQMNELDSRRLVGLLSRDGYLEVSLCRRGRSRPAEHLLGPGQGRTEGLRLSRADRRPQAAQARSPPRRLRLCRATGRGGDPPALTRRRLRARDREDRAPPGDRPKGREGRRPARGSRLRHGRGRLHARGGRADGCPSRFHHHHRRMQQELYLLRGAYDPRPRAQSPNDRDRRGMPASRR